MGQTKRKRGQENEYKRKLESKIECYDEGRKDEEECKADSIDQAKSNRHPGLPITSDAIAAATVLSVALANSLIEIHMINGTSKVHSYSLSISSPSSLSLMPLLLPLMPAKKKAWVSYRSGKSLCVIERICCLCVHTILYYTRGALLAPSLLVFPSFYVFVCLYVSHKHTYTCR